jgi:amino acid adenylation domain-containing protein
MIISTHTLLHDLVINHAQQVPNALAVKGPDSAMTYSELDRQANQFAHALFFLNVQPGDRVGIWLDKSALAVAAMQGVLRTGAIYVPLDPLSPPARIRTIVQDSGMRILITTQQRAEYVSTESDNSMPITYLLTDAPLASFQQLTLFDFATEPVASPAMSENDIAYILYTSGSTGIPKGVCISHRNALAFVSWAVEAFEIREGDRFSNHAPFHFDLSVLDLYGAFATGAAVVLVPENIAYMPTALVDFLRKERITIWYSVPSVLILMMEQGELFKYAPPDVRCVLFAGEPFPIKHLRRLYSHWSSVRYFNLYGPTETNVCTYYEVTTLPDNWNKPVPIGQACSGDHVWIQRMDGSRALPGEEGELMVEGPTVMVGYWGQPPHGNRPYATGDIVCQQADSMYLYLGRRDHMVKVRGYRVELGDIEATLALHSAIHEVAVLVIGTGIDARIVAFITCPANQSPSLLELKRYCAERLPRYMIIDDVQMLEALPRTRNGKIDRLALSAMSLSSTY